MEYAYLGELTPETFESLHKEFPAIVGIGTSYTDNDSLLIVAGVSKEMNEQTIGIYQLIIQLWDNDEATKAVWDALL